MKYIFPRIISNINFDYTKNTQKKKFKKKIEEQNLWILKK